MAEASEPKAEEQMSINDTVIIRDLPVGTKVRLRSKAIAEVTANPRDGGWLFVKFMEFPDSPGRVGEDDMVFCTDVLSVV
jgi:hypothetical protein